MKPIPIFQDSGIFTCGQFVDLQQLMSYYYSHKTVFSQMWKEQGAEYWLCFMISFEQYAKHYIETRFASSSLKIQQTIDKMTGDPATITYKAIADCLLGSTVDNVHQLMDDIWFFAKYKDDFLEINTSEFPDKSETYLAACQHLFGSKDSPVHGLEWSMVLTYLDAAFSLTRICMQFEAAPVPVQESTLNKKFWSIPKEWLLSKYKPSAFESILLESQGLKLLALINKEKQAVPWITSKMSQSNPQSSSLGSNAEKLPKMPHLEVSYRKLFDAMTILNLRIKTSPWETVTDDNVVPFTAGNEILLAQYSLLFGTKFLGVFRKAINLALDASKDRKSDMQKQVQQMRLLKTLSRACIIHLNCKRTYGTSKGTNGATSINSFADWNYLMGNDANDWESALHLTYHTTRNNDAFMDRIPWDIPLIMAFQDDLYKNFLTLELAMVPLTLFGIAKKNKPSVELMFRFIREIRFVFQSAMLVADYLSLLEGEDNYQWQETLDFRKYLHEFGYRLRSVVDYFGSDGYEHCMCLLEDEWPVHYRHEDGPGREFNPLSGLLPNGPLCRNGDKSTLESRHEASELDVEEYFVESPRHFTSWFNDEDISKERMDKIFPSLFEKLRGIKMTQENLRTNVYVKKRKFPRWDLSKAEAAIVTKLRLNKSNKSELDIKELIYKLMKNGYLDEDDKKEFIKKLNFSKVPQEALNYIKSHGLIYLSYEAIIKRQSEIGRLNVCKSNFQLASLISICKINVAVHEIARNYSNLIAKPTAEILEQGDVLSFSLVNEYDHLDIARLPSELQSYREKMWSDNPIPKLPRDVPRLKDDDSFKSNCWETSSIIHWTLSMEKNRFLLIRTVAEKLFSTSRDSTDALFFPYWLTLTCFMKSEICSLIGLAKDHPRKICNKVLQLINFRFLWMRKKVEAWSRNPQDPEVFDEVDPNNPENELLLRFRVASNTLRNIFASCLLNEESVWPVQPTTFNSVEEYHKLYKSAIPTVDQSSDVMQLFLQDCYFECLQETTRYLETLTEHAQECWKYRPVEFHDQFQSGSVEHCESILFVVKRLQYACVPQGDTHEKLHKEYSVNIRRIHLVEKMLTEKKNISSNSAFSLSQMLNSCCDCWFAYKKFDSHFSPKTVTVPSTFVKDVKKSDSAGAFLALAGANELEEIQNLLHITQVPGEKTTVSATKEPVGNYSSKEKCANLGKKNNGSKKTEVNIVAEGIRKMFQGLSKKENDQATNSVPDKTNGTTLKEDEKENIPRQEVVGSSRAEVVMEPALTVSDSVNNKFCASCKKEEPKGVKYKKCQRCKDEQMSSPKYYCGRPCQLKDWEEKHRQEHLLECK